MSFSDHNAIQLDINIKTKGKNVSITWKILLFIFKRNSWVNKKLQIKMLNI